MTIDVARIAFAQKEYRTTEAIEDLSVKEEHPLAMELEYNTLISLESDAEAFGLQVLNLRKINAYTWNCFVAKSNYLPFQVGQTIKLFYPRYGFEEGAEFIVKRARTDSNALFDELTLYGPKSLLATGQGSVDGAPADAFSLNFRTGKYWVQGVSFPLVTSLSGFSYSRTGAVRILNGALPRSAMGGVRNRRLNDWEDVSPFFGGHEGAGELSLVDGKLRISRATGTSASVFGQKVDVQPGREYILRVERPYFTDTYASLIVGYEEGGSEIHNNSGVWPGSGPYEITFVPNENNIWVQIGNNFAGGTDYVEFSYPVIESTEFDGVSDYAANVAPIVKGKGFFNYRSLTNEMLNSVSLSGTGWGPYQITVVPNAIISPDGSLTASHLQSTSPPGGVSATEQYTTKTAASEPWTLSVFLKRAEWNFCNIVIGNGGLSGFCRLVVDLASGTIISSVAEGSGFTLEFVKVLPIGGGWYRCVLGISSDANASLRSLFYVSETSDAIHGTAGASRGIYAWQAQLIKGLHYDGGPLLTTVGATATIGAGSLVTNVNSLTTDRDFILFGAMTLPEAGHMGDGSYQLLVTLGNNTTYLGRNSSGNLMLNMGGSVLQSISPFLVPGRYVFLWRRRGGKNTLAYKLPDETVTIGNETGIIAFSALTNQIKVGHFGSPATDQPDGAVEFLTAREGTFSDDNLLTILRKA